MDSNKNGVQSKINLRKVNQLRLLYIVVAIILMFSSIYKVNIMGYKDSFTIMNYALSGFNFGTIYLVILLFSLMVEVIVPFQENKIILENKDNLNLLLPLICLICSIFFIIKGFSLRREALGTGSVSITLFIGVLMHLLFLIETKYPGKVITSIRHLKREIEKD